jgi:branched-chain amino acid transport system substrate-binding protein
MTQFNIESKRLVGFSRRRLLQLGGGVAGATLIPGLVGQVGRAYADDKPALGTWPAGSQGDTVTIGLR